MTSGFYIITGNGVVSSTSSIWPCGWSIAIDLHVVPPIPRYPYQGSERNRLRYEAGMRDALDRFERDRRIDVRPSSRVATPARHLGRRPVGRAPRLGKDAT